MEIAQEMCKALDDANISNDFCTLERLDIDNERKLSPPILFALQRNLVTASLRTLNFHDPEDAISSLCLSQGLSETVTSLGLMQPLSGAVKNKDA